MLSQLEEALAREWDEAVPEDVIDPFERRPEEELGALVDLQRASAGELKPGSGRMTEGSPAIRAVPQLAEAQPLRLRPQLAREAKIFPSSEV